MIQQNKPGESAQQPGKQEPGKQDWNQPGKGGEQGKPGQASPGQHNPGQKADPNKAEPNKNRGEPFPADPAKRPQEAPGRREQEERQGGQGDRQRTQPGHEHNPQR